MELHVQDIARLPGDNIIPEEWKQYPLASDFTEYELNKVYLRKGIRSRRGTGRGSEIGKDLEPWTWSRNGRSRLWLRGIRGQKLRNWKKLLEEKAKEKNIEIISIIIRQGQKAVMSDEITFADIKKIPNGRCMCKFKCPCGAIDIKIVRDICYGNVHFECKNCSEQQRLKDMQTTKLNYTDEKKEEIIRKMEETYRKNTGYDHPAQNPEVREKARVTYRKKTGYDCSFQNPEVQEKARVTYRKRTGYDNPSQNPEVRDKVKKTTFENNGFECALSHSAGLRESFKVSRTKIYKYPSGREDEVQGYEPQCLNDLIHNEGICEKDIITDRRKVPEIWWEDEDGVRHRHYVDIFIISQNKCVEVKSDWILYNRTNGAFKKQEAGKKLGYEYEIRVYNEKGDIIERYN